MAGSLTWRSYTADSGITYSIRVDESNSRATVSSNAAPLCPVRTANYPAMPSGLKKRYVLAYSQANPNIRRKFWVGDVAQITNVLVGGLLIGEDYPGAADAAGVNANWVITAYRGEKSRVIPTFGAPDTGLTDGTVGQ